MAFTLLYQMAASELSELGRVTPNNRSTRMAYRTFTDSHGTEWQTWDVVPRLGDRRVNERRAKMQSPPHTDRRSRTERRVLTMPRAVLLSGLDSGWLCFAAPDEKRRLSPIPDDWARCAVERLEQYCAQAAPARRNASELRITEL
jgi:hypothetical protein